MSGRFSPEKMKRYKAITLKILDKNSDYVITADIARPLGIANESVRWVINDLIDDGHAIVSRQGGWNRGGYKIARTKEDEEICRAWIINEAIAKDKASIKKLENWSANHPEDEDMRKMLQEKRLTLQFLELHK